MAKSKRQTRKKSQPESVQLRSVSTSLDVDAQAGTIRNAAVLTVGTAIGRGFDVDRIMLQQVYDLFASAQELPIRMTHPRTDPLTGEDIDALPMIVGSATTPRLDGDVLRADLHLLESAPNRSFLLEVAQKMPRRIGLSIEVMLDRENVNGTIVGRAYELKAVDFVATPAANRSGLLSARKSLQTGDTAMTEEMIAMIRALLEIPDNIADEDLESYLKVKVAEKENAAPTADEPVEPPADGMGATPPPQLSAKDVERNFITRMTAVRGIAKANKLPEAWAQKQIDAGLELTQVCLNAISERERLDANATPTHLSVGQDRNLDTLGPAISDAICLRVGTIKPDKAHARSREFMRPFVEIGRHYLACRGASDAAILGPSQILDRLGDRGFRKHYPQLVMLAQSTSDFDYITADAMGKSLRAAYMDQPVKWPTFARRETAPDFKSRKFILQSEVATPTARKEGQGITYSTITDGQETATLVEYTGGVVLTRQAQINDDLGAFGRVPMLQGQSCARLEDDVAFGVITANAALSDTVTLYYATTHVNYLASGSGAPSVATIAALEKLILKQKGPKSAARLGIEPAILMVPVTLKVAAEQFIGSVVDPAKSNATPNPYANKLTVVSDARLDDNSTTAWYLHADPNRFDTFVVMFLESEQQPVLRQETDFDTEDVKFAVRHTLVGKALDYRGTAKSIGTT